MNNEEITAAARSVGFTCSSFSETIFQKIPKMQWLGQTASHHQVDCAYTKSSCSPVFGSCSRCTTAWTGAGLRLCPCAERTTTVLPNVVSIANKTTKVGPATTKATTARTINSDTAASSKATTNFEQTQTLKKNISAISATHVQTNTDFGSVNTVIKTTTFNTGIPFAKTEKRASGIYAITKIITARTATDKKVFSLTITKKPAINSFSISLYLFYASLGCTCAVVLAGICVCWVVTIKKYSDDSQNPKHLPQRCTREQPQPYVPESQPPPSMQIPIATPHRERSGRTHHFEPTPHHVVVVVGSSTIPVVGSDTIPVVGNNTIPAIDNSPYMPAPNGAGSEYLQLDAHEATRSSAPVPEMRSSPDVIICESYCRM